MDTVYAMSFACLNCRKSFKRHSEALPKDYPSQLSCSECNSITYNLGRNFKPPKKSDIKQWEKIKYLISHGFFFQKIRTEPNSNDSIPYPKTLEEAKEFVIKYKDYAITTNST